MPHPINLMCIQAHLDDETPGISRDYYRAYTLVDGGCQGETGYFARLG